MRSAVQCIAYGLAGLLAAALGYLVAESAVLILTLAAHAAR